MTPPKINPSRFPLGGFKESYNQKVKPVLQGIGDLAQGFFFIPHDFFNYVTGCDEKVGERNSWFSGFGKYKNNGWDGPIFRIVDFTAHLFYGSINTITWGGPQYLFNQKLGLNIDYFSAPPPKNLREQTRFFFGGLLTLLPARASIVRALTKENLKTTTLTPSAKKLPGENYDQPLNYGSEIPAHLSPKVFVQQTWKQGPFIPTLPKSVKTSAGTVNLGEGGFAKSPSIQGGNSGGPSGINGALQPAIPTAQGNFIQLLSEIKAPKPSNPKFNISETTNPNASPFTLHASRIPPIPLQLPSSQKGEIKDPQPVAEMVVLPGAQKKEGPMVMPSAYHENMVEKSEEGRALEFSIGTEIAFQKVIQRLMEWEDRQNKPGELFKNIENFSNRYPQVFFNQLNHPLSQATPEEIVKEAKLLEQQINDADYMLPEAYENYLLQLYSYALLIKSGHLPEEVIQQGLRSLFVGFASFNENDIRVSYAPGYRGPNLIHWEAHLREMQQAIGRPNLEDLKNIATSGEMEIPIEGNFLSNQQKKDFRRNYQEMFGGQLPRYPEIHSMVSLAFHDLQRGLPIRPFVLSYTGSNELRSFQFVVNSPIEETFPLNYFPLEEYSKIVPNRLLGYDLARGGTNITIEFYLSPPELLMMLSKYKELLEDNRSLAAIQGGMVNLFRSLLRIYHVPIRLISHSYPEIPSPGILGFPKPMGFWEAAFAAKNKIHATYLSPRNLSLNEKEQAYRWSLEMGLALKLNPRLDQITPTTPRKKPK